MAAPDDGDAVHKDQMPGVYPPVVRENPPSGMIIGNGGGTVFI